MTNTAQNISTRRPMLPTPDEMAAAQAVRTAQLLARDVPSLVDTGRDAELNQVLAQMLQIFTGFGSLVWEILDALEDQPSRPLADVVEMLVADF